MLTDYAQAHTQVATHTHVYTTLDSTTESSPKLQRPNSTMPICTQVDIGEEFANGVRVCDRARDMIQGEYKDSPRSDFTASESDKVARDWDLLGEVMDVRLLRFLTVAR